MLKLNDPLLTTGKVEIKVPQTYQEARDRGKTAWDQSNAADLDAEQIERLRAEARYCFRFALAHAPDNAKSDELKSAALLFGVSRLGCR